MRHFQAHVVLTRILVAAFVLCVACAPFAQAAPLIVGGSIFPTPAEPDPVGGQTVCGPLVAPYSTATFSGTLTSAVIFGDTTNPYGGLTFTYVVSNDASSSNVNARLSVNGYDGFLTDASYQVPASGVVPTYVDRQLPGDVVGFSFLGMPVGFGAIEPGQSSSLLVIQTNATTCSNSFASVIDGAIATIPTYAPAPEPTALALLSLGSLVMIRRRR